MKPIFWSVCGLSGFGPQHKFDKRKRRNVTHIYSMPHESGLSLTILFVYLLAYLSVFTGKKTELRNSAMSLPHLYVRKLCRAIQDKTSTEYSLGTLLNLTF